MIAAPPLAAHNPLQFVSAFARDTKHKFDEKVVRRYLSQILREGDGVEMASDAIREAVLARRPALLEKTDDEWSKFRERHSQQQSLTKDIGANIAERLVCQLSAIWTREIVHHYGWDRLAKHALQEIVNCAKRLPRFEEEFVPYANTVLLSRHEAYLLGEGGKHLKPIGQHPTSSPAHLNARSPLQARDFERVHLWVEQKSRKGYGKEPFPEKPGIAQAQRSKEWNNDQDGSLSLKGQSLRNRRRHHEANCVGFDQHGLLIAQPKQFLNPNASASKTTNSNVLGKRRRESHQAGRSWQRHHTDISTCRPPTPISLSPPPPENSSTGDPVQDEVQDLSNDADSQVAEQPTQEICHAPVTDPTSRDEGPMQSQADFVRILPWKEAWELFNKGTEDDTLRVVVSEGEPFTDMNMHNLDEYLEVIRESNVEQLVDVQSSDGETKRMDLEQFLDVRRIAHRDNAQSKTTPNNLLNLRAYSNAQTPAFLRLPRFRLLDALSDLVGHRYNSGPGKPASYNPIDMTSCRQFDILGYGSEEIEYCARSLCHVDVLVGTWIRPLLGYREWDVVDPRSMTPQDWEDFADDPRGWCPGDKAITIHLRPAQVLIMMPGVIAIHRVRTRETSLATGGAFWDKHNVLGILKALLWVCRNPQVTNEAIPQQLPRILHELRKWVHDPDRRQSLAPSSMEGTEFVRKFDELYGQIKKVGCSDRDCKTEKTCSCRAANRKCNEWCECPGKNDVLENPPHCF